MKIIDFTVLAVVIALPVNEVNAAFIDRDYNLSNDGLLTYDTLTGLEWLDITATESLSVTDALSLYSDFRLANRDEVEQLLSNSGFARLNSGQFNYDVVDWCTSLGIREGSNREQGEFVIEKAFVDAPPPDDS